MADAPTLTDLASDLAAEAVDTSEPDVKEEVVVAEPTVEESSTEEKKAEEVESEEASEAKEEEQSESEAEEKSEEKPQGKAEERKQVLNTEIRDLVGQRNQLRSEVERLNAETYAPQTAEEIMAETGQSQAEARITAMEQRQELSDYNNRVAEAQLVIGNESQRVLTDFPMFNPESPEYKKDVAGRAGEFLSQNLLVDPNTGQIIGSNISPYKLYETIASANQASAVENQIKGQKSAEKQLAATEPQSSAVPKQPKEDALLAGLLRGDAYKGIREKLAG